MNRLFKVALFAVLSISPLGVFAQRSDSLQVYFPLNDRNLNKAAQKTIDSLIYNNVLIPGQNLIILGYADYLGSKPYNLSLSKARAENVKLYLEQSGFTKENIRLIIGKGEVERSPQKGQVGYPDDRKVQIVIDRTVAINKPSPPIVQKTKDITKLDTGETMTLENIYFLPGRHTMKEESRFAVDALYDVLNKHKNIKIQIEGHICCDYGSNMPDGYDYDTNDNELSLNRAKDVYYYLIRKGIDSTRMKYIGLGITQSLPHIDGQLYDEDKNRRVEIRVLAK